MRVASVDDDSDGATDETICVDAPELPARTCRLFVPPSDIDTCVRFSMARMLVSAVSLLLALTDIPRTGLGLSSLAAYFNVVGLDTVMYFGPYAYPVAHFSVATNNSSSSTNDNSTYTNRVTADGPTLENVDAWAYKFDSLSISTRALAEHLNVTSYPRCLLTTSQPCASNGLDVRAAFVMLDDLLEAFVARYATSKSQPHSTPVASLMLATTSLWIDRLHQFLAKPVRKNIELRTHIVQHFDASNRQLTSSICDMRPQDGSKQTRSARPPICDSPLIWLCDHPSTTSSSSASSSASSSSQMQVPIWDHIALRIAILQQQYPDLELDLTMISSRLVVESRRSTWLPAVSFTADTTELTTFVRGRVCSAALSANSSTAAPRACRTVFIDDYRYERATCVSDADQWVEVASVLRAIGQCYMWLRFALLCIGCYCARAAERPFARAARQTKLYFTALTVAKIPSHVVVYGSAVPIACYALAHYIDSALIHLIAATVWSTVNGVVRFEPVTYMRVAAIQMRNVWLVALLAQLGVAAAQHVMRPRYIRWTVHDGVVGVRAMLFGVVSALTVFSCLRVRRFRDASIVEIRVVPDASALSSRYVNDTLYGVRLDLLTLALASSVVAAALLLVLAALTLTQRGAPSLALTCHSYHVPHCADSVWPRGALRTHWRMELVDGPLAASLQCQCNDASRHTPDKHNRRSSTPRWRFRSVVAPAPMRNGRRRALSSLPAVGPCGRVSCRYQDTRRSWSHVVQGCPHHNSLVDIARRSRSHWSAVRILNIAMLTDPLVLVHLYAVGRPMLIIRVTQAESPSAQSNTVGESSGQQQQQLRVSSVDRLYVCPAFETGNTAGTAVRHLNASSLCNYELVGSTNSALLPWTVLVNSG